MWEDINLSDSLHVCLTTPSLWPSQQFKLCLSLLFFFAGVFLALCWGDAAQAYCIAAWLMWLGVDLKCKTTALISVTWDFGHICWGGGGSLNEIFRRVIYGLWASPPLHFVFKHVRMCVPVKCLSACGGQTVKPGCGGWARILYRKVHGLYKHINMQISCVKRILSVLRSPDAPQMYKAFH